VAIVIPYDVPHSTQTPAISVTNLSPLHSVYNIWRLPSWQHAKVVIIQQKCARIPKVEA